MHTTWWFGRVLIKPAVLGRGKVFVRVACVFANSNAHAASNCTHDWQTIYDKPNIIHGNPAAPVPQGEASQDTVMYLIGSFVS